MDEQHIVFTLTRSQLTLVRKALQRYRAQRAPGIEEVGQMDWYDNPEVTRLEIARVDAILAGLEQACSLASPRACPAAPP